MRIANESDLRQVLQIDSENEHIEFKEAKNRFDFEDLVKYCCALANEGGGSVVLGVTDKKPRTIVGSKAFKPVARTTAGLYERLHWRVDGKEIQTADGRVVIFSVNGHFPGSPLQYKGAYWMRAGESLAPMSPDRLAEKFSEAIPDFSASTVSDAGITDLDIRAYA